MTDCIDCNHQHAGADLAGICVGCPCASRPSATAEPSPSPSPSCLHCTAIAGPAPGVSLTELVWLRHQGETLTGAPIDAWVCPRCRGLNHEPPTNPPSFFCDACDDVGPCDGCWEAW